MGKESMLHLDRNESCLRELGRGGKSESFFTFMRFSVYLIRRHLLPVRLDDEPEPVAGDGADAEAGHEDGELLPGLDEAAQQTGILAEWPVALQGCPQRQRGGEDAEEEV